MVECMVESTVKYGRVYGSLNGGKITFMNSRAVFHCDIDQRFMSCLV